MVAVAVKGTHCTVTTTDTYSRIHRNRMQKLTSPLSVTTVTIHRLATIFKKGSVHNDTNTPLLLQDTVRSGLLANEVVVWAL
jgi:hypothetical protein